MKVETVEIISKETECPYTISIAIPNTEAPRSGYPVLYVLDGNAFFQTFAETIRIQTRRSEKTGVTPFVVVGIGCPVEEDFVSDYRFYDFTPPANTVELPPHPQGKEWPHHGGADKFLTFMEEEVKPLVDTRCHVDRKKQALFGHSLGGLFSLYTLLSKRDAFQSYIISSPSIWWNNKQVLTLEEKFVASLREEEEAEARYAFICVGELEKGYMVEDAKVLYERLSKIDKQKVTCGYYLAEEENHISVVPTVLSRALRFISKGVS
ncbi:alpha/beta hydrolase [Priestia taiwanensis]|uniref:IroE protein n=1 Tax=Priestia taiwanensis TaxID=1347902 RepID=A0A917EPV7_9BACI|nr:alpha/beta hydrolase-fold protein [Priestia taiwanensis]MBM7362607.1 putative alpha/beta superfamily hydrolase [Priestia taiwanensis]GGE63623.1 IroE protein [Priestia taiwanensis]